LLIAQAEARANLVRNGLLRARHLQRAKSESKTREKDLAALLLEAERLTILLLDSISRARSLDLGPR